MNLRFWKRKEAQKVPAMIKHDMINNVISEDRGVRPSWASDKDVQRARRHFEGYEDWQALMLDTARCPDCGHIEWLEGPSGGMSTNVKCANCGSKFNWAPGVNVDRI